MKINNPDNLPDEIIQWAIDQMKKENRNRTITEITVRKTDKPDEIGITPVFKKEPFERIRRITGYLAPVDRWNPAKQAELKDRVKHT